MTKATIQTFLSTNVTGAVIMCNTDDGLKILAGKKGNDYILPQGSEDPNDNDNIQTTVYREIEEETGLTRSQLMHISTCPVTLSYKLRSTPRLFGINFRSVKWFLFNVKTTDTSKINLKSDKREFPDGLHWVTWRELLESTPMHKIDMYKYIEKAFALFLTA